MTDSKTPLSWRESIQAGNFEQAEARIQALELVGEYHPELLAAVQAMVALLGDVRSRQFSKALQQTRALEPLREFLSPEELRLGIENLQQTEKQDTRDPEALKAQLQTALDTPYVRAEALNRLGVLQVRLKDPVQARSLFEAAVQADPRHYRAISNLGNIALEAGNNKEAEAHYRKALEINPEYPLAHNNLAVLLRKQKRYGASIQSLKKSQRLEQRALLQQAREEGRQQSMNLRLGAIAFYVVLVLLVLWFVLSR
ncbi:tetratricopeptide repeat protein [Deinococcus roseus]|uniref:Tetratricopeptide repeat protein n=1 Tax=Deinococcus roseus TaxID=392414 RepID=A0ABQ2DDU7_9DEIO|nr:tetratricopeptide repeat protein [Deinococcus roseus]GGJ54299.1 hypothetical protein GCM10008938_45490 [Deinococcus roseus]